MTPTFSLDYDQHDERMIASLGGIGVTGAFVVGDGSQPQTGSCVTRLSPNLGNSR